MIKEQSTEFHITTWRSFASQISTSRFDLEFLLGVYALCTSRVQMNLYSHLCWKRFMRLFHSLVSLVGTPICLCDHVLMSGLTNSLFWVCPSVLEIFVMIKIFVLSFCLPVHCGEIFLVVKTILWDLWKQIAFKPRFLASRVEKERRAVLSELQMMNTIEYRVDCQVWFVIAFSNPLPFQWSELQAKVWFESSLSLFFCLLIHVCWSWYCSCFSNCMQRIC